MYEFTLRQLRNLNQNENEFFSLYKRLMIDKSFKMSDSQKTYLLSNAVILLNQSDKNLIKLGYRIIVQYANQYNDYIPLYDTSINLGFIPVAKFIEKNFLITPNKGLSANLTSAYIENFKHKNKYLTLEQKDLYSFAQKTDSSILIVAPTSYGKSELIIKIASQNLNKKVCILVPTKALLAQTQKRLLNNDLIFQKIDKIISHAEMYKNENKFIAVLTQERLLALLKENKDLKIDILMIDEAHNLFNNSERDSLLYKVMMIVKNRNPNTIFKFFSPFIAESKNIKSPNFNINIQTKQIREFIKIERFYLFDALGDKKLKLYDQFLDEIIDITDSYKQLDEIDFLRIHSDEKNIIYSYRPKQVIEIANKLCSRQQEIDIKNTKEYKAIATYIHKDYNLLKFLEKGIVCHFASIPETIKMYIENMYNKNPNLKYIITTSTLLQGVNIPAKKIFLLSNKCGKRNSILTASSFKNLIGRTCRFSEIFSNENKRLDLLEPEIYIIKTSYFNPTSNLQNYIRKVANISNTIKDDVKNNMINPQDSEEYKKEIQYLENMETGIVKDQYNELTISKTLIGKLCFENNIRDFDIIKNEQILSNNLNNLKQNIGKKISSPEDLIQAIYLLFIKDINIDEGENFIRLKEEKARKFYQMILTWKINNTPYNQMINYFLNYWDTRIRNNDPIIYVGSTWGEVSRENNYANLYINLRTKSQTDKINLATVKIKEEQDFIEHHITKYSEIINKLNLIDSSFFEKIKYGSNDKKIITMLKNGYSYELAQILNEKEYENFITFNFDKETLVIDKKILPHLENNNINDIFIFELKFHIKDKS